MNSKNANIAALFGDAGTLGTLSNNALNALDAEDIGANIQQGLGVVAEDIKEGEVTLVLWLIDDSGSIRFVSGNSDAVRQGHNGGLDALKKTKQRASILTYCRYLNRTQLYPFSRLDDAVYMDGQNYNPMGGTPLYDETLVVLGAAAAKQQEFFNNGVACRVVTAIVTDGHDEGSRKRAKDVAAVANSLLKSESHIIIGVGIDDGLTDFKAVFNEMGIQDDWILTPKNSPSEIRKAFAMVSQSAVRASQGAGSFSKTAMGGGFGKP